MTDLRMEDQVTPERCRFCGTLYLDDFCPCVRARALEALRVEVETGLVGDEECARRLDLLGATDDEVEDLFG